MIATSEHSVLPPPPAHGAVAQHVLQGHPLGLFRVILCIYCNFNSVLYQGAGPVQQNGRHLKAELQPSPPLPLAFSHQT